MRYFIVIGLALGALVVGCGGDDDDDDDVDAGDADVVDDGGNDGSSDGHVDSGRDASDEDAGQDADVGEDADVADATPDGSDAHVCEEACGEDEVCCPQGLSAACVSNDDIVDGGCPLPDLTVNDETLSESFVFGWLYFGEDDCAVAEGCITETGWRRVVRFDTETPNMGNADLFLGTPDVSNPVFQYSGCHMHFHFNGYADYKLLSEEGEEVGTGHKQAFCLLDSQQVREGANPRERYDCSYQGIQAGWSDVYYRDLDCQWIDVTDLSPDDYVMRVSINQGGVLAESSLDNNIVEVPMTLPPAPTDPLADCTATDEAFLGEEVPGRHTREGRECGWDVSALSNSECEAGADYYVGCMATAGCGLEASMCERDPILRVCDGEGACTAPESIASNDDDPMCGRRNHCPRARFTCPASGHFTVLTAAYESADPYVCVPTTTRVL